jgi:AMMECR1 domain-containing protein
VTWNIHSSRPGGHTRLRGCIGSFEAQTLHEGLQDYALISAFKDSRFRRIEEHELERLECWCVSLVVEPSRLLITPLAVSSVSLLTDFEDANSYLDWTIGTHGIHITFPHPSTLLSASASSTPSPLSSSANLLIPRFTSKRSFSATYLPEVIPDQEWTKIEAIDSAIEKAGWDGTITEDLRRSIKLRRYQSSKCLVTWDEYWQYRRERATA